MAADEAVAHGAALHAGLMLARQEGLPPLFKVRNVNSHSLGVVGLDPLTRQFRNGILIPRNTRLPVTSKRTFKTRQAGQRSIGIDIVEGGEPVGRRLHADRPLLGPPPAARPAGAVSGGSPLPLRAERAVEGPRDACPAPDRKITTEIVRENGMSKEHLDDWRQAISGLPPGEYR